jgi:tetratricopeptide (TPR) repeat protein
MLGAATAALAWFWGGAGVPCDLWEEIAVAAGLRPPTAPFPCVWHAMVQGLFSWLGVERGLAVLRAAGPAALGVTTGVGFALLHELLPAVLRRRMQCAGWSRVIVRMVLAQGAVCFACSEPVWNACRFFSPATLQFIVTIAAAVLCVRAFRLKEMRLLYAAAAMLGVLAAETPVGLLMPAALVAYGRWKGGRASVPGDPDPLIHPFVRTMAVRRITYSFFCGFLPAMALNAVFFCMHDGLEAHGWNGFEYVLHVAARYVRLFATASSFMGWSFLALFAVLPLVFSGALLRKATDDDRFLPLAYGVFYVFAGVAAFLQLAGWRVFWFWAWTTPQNVSSPYLLCISSVLSAVTFSLSLCVLGVEVYFRNFRKIAGTRFEDAVEDAAAQPVVDSFHSANRLRRALLRCEPLLVFALVLPMRMKPVESQMKGMLDEYLRLTAEESAGAKMLFTDGALDAGLELAALRQGRTLRTLSMMSSSAPRDIFLRRRAALDEEDELALASGASDAMRTWVRHKPRRMKDFAIQIGFELWRHDKLPMPLCGGFVAYPDGGLDAEAAARGAVAATNLAHRIVSLYEKGEPMAADDVGLRQRFCFMQWRLARMCRMRADAADGAGRKAEAMAESTLADSLDACNEAFGRLRRQMDWVGMQRGARLTLREGLKIGLDRADFRLARTYAQQVLASDPNDSAANFAIGMGYFVEEQYARAEEYLKRSLKGSPDEPAALNNLAIALMRQGRLAEAETNAAHAARVLQGAKGAATNAVQAVRRTVEAIAEKRREERLKTAAP